MKIMIKTKVKLIVGCVIMLIVICLCGSNSVKAYSKEDVKIEGKIEQGLIDDVEEETNANDPDDLRFYFTLNTNKVIELLLNGNKLDSLVENDNMVYENVYFKLANDVTTASIAVEEKEKDLEIVTINNERYAKCSLGLFQKEQNTYTLTGECTPISVCGVTAKFKQYAILKLKNENNTIKKISLSYGLPEGGEGEVGGYLEINNKAKEIPLQGWGVMHCIDMSYDRQELAKSDDLYVTFAADINVGNSINIEPFGTLNFIKKNDDEHYIYEKVISDKEIFNKDYIKGTLIIPEYNLLYLYNIACKGDLIKKDSEVTKDIITITDKTTNIKLDATTGAVPEDAKLIINKITEGDLFTNINKILSSGINKFELYNINLSINNATIQPNGKVKLSMPVPNGYDTSKLAVYKIAEDGNKIKYNITINDGYIEFETDNLDNYVVAEEKENPSTETSSSTDNTSSSSSSNKNNQLDNTPKTGTKDYTTIVSYIVSTICTLGLAIIKKV